MESWNEEAFRESGQRGMCGSTSRLGAHKSARLLTLISALLTGAVLLCATASTASALPENFFGLSSDASYWDSTEDWDAIGHSGADVFHMQINWGQVIAHGNWEDPSGWEQTYDKYIGHAATQGLTVIPYLYGRKDYSPQYYRETETVNWNAWFEFVRTAVQRYGHNGSYWSTHPNVPYTPINAWEVWNEPNLPVNNPGGQVNPPLYAKFFKATANKIRSSQSAIGGPNPTVLLGGLYQYDAGMNTWQFLESASTVPNFQMTFDGLSLHPYSFYGSFGEKLAGVVQNLDNARKALNQFGGVGKSIWITELGWPVAGNKPTVSEADQASLLTSIFSWLKGNQQSYNLQLVSWYFYRDVFGDSSWDHYAGLRDASSGRFKPSWWAYLEQAGAQPWPLTWYRDTLGGYVTSDPDISSWNPGRLDVFVRGAGGELAHKWYETGQGWGSWENWGGSLAAGAGPGAVSWGPGKIDIVARAPDNSVVHWNWDGSSLHIGNLGGNITSDPDISSWESGRLDVFARGTDSTLQHKYFVNGSWSAWESLGGTLASGPGAVSWGPSRIDVVAKAPDNSISHWALSP